MGNKMNFFAFSISWNILSIDLWALLLFSSGQADNKIQNNNNIIILKKSQG